jgi:oxygen-independent coproporphyrinogen III oxidase
MDRPRPPWGIYVHVPWCRVRCPYCAFNVHPDRDAQWSEYADGVARDLALWRPSFTGEPDSVYLGGGTPSLLPLDVLARLLRILPSAGEITLEANPGSAEVDALTAWRELGITRLSLGIQTFDPRYAGMLNRGHSVDDALDLLAAVRVAGFSTWSFDLMFGLPGQTLGELDADLAHVIDHRPPHVSLYGLTVEPGTPWERAVASGKLVPVGEDDWRAMYDRIVERLETAGWERYEVSNFALPGHRSRHNEAIWRGGHYAGLGPGAHGFLPDGERTVATAEPAEWLRSPIASRERPTKEQAATDRILGQLRHRDGLDLDSLRTELGCQIDDRSLDVLVDAGLVSRRGAALALTDEGFALADAVTRHVVGAIRIS